MLLVLPLLLSIAFIVLATARLNLHPFLALLITAFGFGILSGMPLADVVKSVNEGFGGTIGSIGIVIIAGTIIGVFLEKSRGAFRLAAGILRITGQRNAPLGMSIMGYPVSIPVFCDSGFLILSSLNKAVARRAGISLAATSVALALGLYAARVPIAPYRPDEDAAQTGPQIGSQPVPQADAHAPSAAKALVTVAPSAPGRWWFPTPTTASSGWSRSSRT